MLRRYRRRSLGLAALARSGSAGRLASETGSARFFGGGFFNLMGHFFMHRTFGVGLSSGVLTSLVVFAFATTSGSTVLAGPIVAIDTSAFMDSASHWRTIKQPERIMQANAQQAGYASEQVREIAANILLFQRDNGGWPKDYDMLAVLTEPQRALIRNTRANADTSYDNHTTHPQVAYMARAFVVTGDESYRTACLRGVEFMLASQYANGGFPQWWPKAGTIAQRITFNDGVMIGILSVLKDAADGAAHFAWLEEPWRRRAAAAVERGTTCLVKMQIMAEGRRTGWGQQHDEKTLATVGARTFEMPCISPADTTEVVAFMMRLAKPSPEVVGAIEAAVGWLKKVQLNGIRVERVAAPKSEFARHTTEHDVVVIADAKAAPLWARMVEPGTDRPIFASRDGVKVYSLAEVDRERRTGSGWYVGSPRRLLAVDYPQWQAQWAQP